MSSTLSLLSFTVPPRPYTNSANNTIVVHTSYTGATTANVTYTLTLASASASAGPYVLDPYRTFNVRPNTIQDVAFATASTQVPGNYLYNLAIVGPFPGSTYSVWMNVTANPAPALQQSPRTLVYIAAVTMVVAMAVVSAILVARLFGQMRSIRNKSERKTPRRGRR
ncbi:Uncharacterised protein [uncultured archaeon]|nr:Uncharacterised protein [uncultured archaeon]